jgi:hypothetical protein
MLATAYSAQGLAATAKAGVTPSAPQTPVAVSVHQASAQQPVGGASVSAQPPQYIATAEPAQREIRAPRAVETSMSVVNASAAAPVEREIFQLPAQPAASRVAVDDARGWTALELTFGVLAIVLVLLFVFRSWSQGNPGRSF